MAIEPGHDDAGAMRRFGCGHCYASANPASQAEQLGVLEKVSVLVDKSHFDVSVRRCTYCGQQFVFVWTEFVDLSGQDPQYWTLIPVDDAELEAIIAMGRRPDLEYIGSLGLDRRCLAYNHPRDSAATWNWVENTRQWLTEGH
jgi:hypothetical protein